MRVELQPLGIPSTRPDLAKPTLEGLSYLLRHKELWPKEFTHWNYTKTNHCAIGLSVAYWKDNFPTDKMTVLQKTFGMGMVSFIRIFALGGFFNICVSPENVADKIDAYQRRKSRAFEFAVGPR